MTTTSWVERKLMSMKQLGGEAADNEMPNYMVQAKKVIVWKGKFLELVRETPSKKTNRIEG